MTSSTRPVGSNDLDINNIGEVHDTELDENTKAARMVADLAVRRHHCELDRDNGVTECRHPNHALDADACRRALAVLGLAEETLRTQTDGLGRRRRPKARCRVCGTVRALTEAGAVLTHETQRGGGGRCEGSLRPPAAQQEAS